jgi:hypothetical protein
MQLYWNTNSVLAVEKVMKYYLYITKDMETSE